MVAKVQTVAFQGIEACPVEVQVHLSSGLPAFHIVGLPDKAVGESRERVRAALSALGLALPAQRITINLAPANLIKAGTHYDLPIALGLLLAMGTLEEDKLLNHFALGELGLDGSLASVPGVLPAAIEANRQGAVLLCSAHDGHEAAWSGLEEIIAAPNLLDLINHLKGRQALSPPQKLHIPPKPFEHDFKNVKGQETAKRALEIAAAGGHNLLMSGPPGAGKSLLASCLPSILPAMTAEEALEVSMIHSISGKLQEGVIHQRPFQAPHHSASLPALVGGTSRALPGEISLAHNGVLFLDELPEFQTSVLESLRQPLENKTISISRANAHVVYPANFQLIAAMNPCRCGYFGDLTQGCSRQPKCRESYQRRLSGPLLDRIDLYIEVEAVSALDLTRPQEGRSSDTIREHVKKVREFQNERLNHLKKAGTKNVPTNNAGLQGDLLLHLTQADPAGQELIQKAAQKLNLSARAYYRVLRLARTIADLQFEEKLKKVHLAESLSYRPKSLQSTLTV